jgi:hypothetical protein
MHVGTSMTNFQFLMPTQLFCESRINLPLTLFVYGTQALQKFVSFILYHKYFHFIKSN